MIYFNLQEHMNLYRQYMNSLINEKASYKQNQIMEKQVKVQKFINHIFFIEGDSTFQQQMKEDLDKIVTIKPGRKLIKALSKTGKQITIESAKLCQQRGLKVSMAPDQRHAYSALSQENEKVTASRKRWIILAHELIHVLHYCTDDQIARDETRDILKEMTNLEEQHTICGFNHAIFSAQKVTDKIAVLCENAFLLAVKLPPRINHANGSLDQLHVQKEGVAPEQYYDWLEKELTLIREIPEAEKENEEFILKYIQNYPTALQTISPKLRTEAFFLNVISIHSEFTPYLPSEYLKDRSFMIKAFQMKATTLLYIDFELYKDKDFAFFILKNTKPLLKKIFFDNLTPVLKVDPEIVELMKEAQELS